MPRKMARQTLERHAGTCYAGSRSYLGSGLLGVQKIATICPTSEFIRGIPINVVQKEVFRDTVPWIVIRVCS
jgi:hypothetical protein